MKDPRPKMTSAASLGDCVQSREAFENPDGVIRAQHGDRRGQPDLGGPRSYRGKDYSGADIAKSARWCSPTPITSSPTSSARTPSSTTLRSTAS